MPAFWLAWLIGKQTMKVEPWSTSATCFHPVDGRRDLMTPLAQHGDGSMPGQGIILSDRRAHGHPRSLNRSARFCKVWLRAGERIPAQGA